MTDESEPAVLVSFPDVEAAMADELADELSTWLADDTPRAQVNRVRQDELAQDFGATLAIVLGSTAVTALARGIATWLARRQDVKVTIRRTRQDGRVDELEISGQPGRRTEVMVKEFLT